MKDVREALMVGRNSEGKLVRRPLSPHLQAYNMVRISSGTSIVHRITGVALSGGALFLTAWLAAAAAGDSAFSVVQAVYGSWFGLLVLVGFTWALFYHALNGLRHLAWDAGKGFELPAMYRSGQLAIAGSIVLTLVTWVIALWVW
jgi:succinate dehydrogenase / fumarate reductase cytochrome b subunit